MATKKHEQKAVVDASVTLLEHYRKEVQAFHGIPVPEQTAEANLVTTARTKAGQAIIYALMAEGIYTTDECVTKVAKAFEAAVEGGPATVTI